MFDRANKSRRKLFRKSTELYERSYSDLSLVEESLMSSKFQCGPRYTFSSKRTTGGSLYFSTILRVPKPLRVRQSSYRCSFFSLSHTISPIQTQGMFHKIILLCIFLYFMYQAMQLVLIQVGMFGDAVAVRHWRVHVQLDLLLQDRDQHLLVHPAQ